MQLASKAEVALEFHNDDGTRYGETKFPKNEKPKVFLNERKLREAGAKGDFMAKSFLGESLHNLKSVDRPRYDRLKEAALSSPEYLGWVHESFRVMNDNRVERGDAPIPAGDIDQWHDESRFDQVIGGFLQAGDPDLPTMKNWDRDKLPFGAAFRKELLKLEADLKK